MEGDDASLAISTITSPSTPSSSSPQYSAGTSNLPTSFGAFRGNNSSLPHSRKRSIDQHSLKIVLAKVENKRIGDHLRLNFFHITEATANVADITSMVREFYEDEDLVLVPPTKCLTKFEDSPPLRTMSFWKNNSRRIFAVKERDIAMDRQQQSSGTTLQNVMVGLNRIETKIDTYSDLATVCSKVFKCLICLLPAGPDIIFGGCCKQLLGCEGCVSPWFAENDTCLHCRSDEGSEKIIQLRCFGEIIEKLR